MIKKKNEKMLFLFFKCMSLVSMHIQGTFLVLHINSYFGYSKAYLLILYSLNSLPYVITYKVNWGTNFIYLFYYMYC